MSLYGSLLNSSELQAAAATGAALRRKRPAHALQAAAPTASAAAAAAPKVQRLAPKAQQQFIQPARRRAPTPSAAPRAASSASASASSAGTASSAARSAMLRPSAAPQPDVAASAAAPAPGGGQLFSAPIANEYAPSRPHDYEALLAGRRRARQLDVRFSQHRWEREAAAPAAAASAAHAPAGRGRGRGRSMTAPAWQTGAQQQPPAGAEPPPRGSGRAPAAAAAAADDGGNIGERMLMSMGYKSGQGLGRVGQGIVVPLHHVKKTSGAGKHVAKIAGGNETSRVVAANPTTIVLLKNIVDRDDVDDELQDEIASECSKHGRVVTCKVVVDAVGVRVYVQFATLDGAIRARQDLDGRFFGGRTVAAFFANRLE